jgi:hypothetical protein
MQHGQHQLKLVSRLIQVDEHITAQQLLPNFSIAPPAAIVKDKSASFRRELPQGYDNTPGAPRRA